MIGAGLLMPNLHYNWKRFWCPRTGIVNLSDGGYLVNPDSEWGRYYNSEVVSFDSISSIPCLILLGEPGMGKSYSMRAEREAIDVKIAQEGGQTYWLDLRSYGSEDRLIRNLFESPVFSSWKNGNYHLHVFLDSLDECLLRVDTLAALLIDELKKCPITRLNLRISCRTADWPTGLEDGLQQLWEKDSIGVYELAPLRKIDVIEAAKANEIEPDAFLSEIDRMEAVPLVIKPVTLGFLLNTYKRKGQLPSTQAELYLQGCQILCEESNKNRRDARISGELTAGQRMAVAARIAAVTIFANRYAIWTDLDLGNIPEDDISFQDLCGGDESFKGEHFNVSEAAIRETLATGLFSSRGPNRMGWAHQTYAEFLAALYLTQQEMTPSQIMSFIAHPADPERKLVPQLHETAAWLAGMNQDVFCEIMMTDPEVLLRSDVATANVKEQAALVDNLLKLYDEEKLLDIDLDMHGRYRKLNHPGLADQLRPFICDGAKGFVVRRVAIDIAEACELQTLQNDLVKIALDPTESIVIRIQAAYAVGRIGDDEAKAKLKPLATGEVGDDPDDELKGCGLRAVWPTHMSAEELFAVLTPPKQENLLGAYRAFLSHELTQHLQPNDLLPALKWVERQQSRRTLPDPLDGILDTIMLLAWEHLKLPGVLELFAKIAMSCLENHDVIAGEYHNSPFREVLRDNPDKRRKLLRAMLSMHVDPEKDLVLFVYSGTPVVLTEDIPWMIERLLAIDCEEEQRKWAQLIFTAFDWRERSQAEAILIACKESSVLARTFKGLFEPVEIESPEAKKSREDYLKRQKWMERRHERPLLEPPPAERISKLLDECESSNSAAWWRLNMEMTLEPDSTHYKDELESDITVLPGWKTADTDTKGRIVNAAKKYVMEQEPNTEKWLGTNIIHRPALAGYRALRLLLLEDPIFITTVPVKVWEKWAPIILAYPTSSGIGEEPHHRLIKIAYQYAFSEIIKTLIILIDEENSKHDNIFITRKVVDCWDDRLANALLAKVKDENLKPKCMSCLLCDLLDHGVNEAKTFAESLIALPISTTEEKRSRAVVAARALMNHTDNAGWPVVWPAIQQDAEFGRDVILEVAHDYDRPKVYFGQCLTENQLADLFIWVVRQFPYSEDPKHEGAHFMGPRERVTSWRDGILSHLKSKGTHDACDAIRRIAIEFPELDWLKRTLYEAQRITRRSTWVSFNSADILKIAGNREGRLVQNGDQLLEVIIESLRRLEEKLHGETPAVADLWNKIGDKYCRPKDENGFSDYVKRHLDEDLRSNGIIVNREVEIRRAEGPGSGQRTDIHVDAVIRGPGTDMYDTVSVIIEVKGCWHSELKEAMRTQLVNRYLKDNQCQHGLYLVGWFNCDQWDNLDTRRRQAPACNIDEAREFFNAQATELSQQELKVKAFVMRTSITR